MNGRDRPSSQAGPSKEEEAQLIPNGNTVKLVLLGDSAVGKSKLVERFLLDGYKPHQLSTYALTLYRYDYKSTDGRTIPVDIWDTAGQERFNTLHPSYYYKACVCIMVFDVTRKTTYKNLEHWYEELQQHAKGIPTFVVANKIDVDYKVTEKKFGFPEKHGLPFTFVSASDGVNVVKVFESAIEAGLRYKESPKEDFFATILDLLEDNNWKMGSKSSMASEF